MKSQFACYAQAMSQSQRLDKWLWFARVVKTRTLAAGLVQDGKVRLNRSRVTKPSQLVKAGDVITISVHGSVRVLRVLEGGARRGPATEAAGLFEEIAPVTRVNPSGVRQRDSGQTDSGRTRSGQADALVGTSDVDGDAGGPPAFVAGGRPTKKDRRILDRLRDRFGV